MKCVSLVASLALCSLIAALPAHGQAFPNHAIRLIVPFAPGGPTDAIARLIAQRWGESVGQQIIIDNRVGANAIIGTALGAKAPADGYTLVMVAFPHGINPSLYPKIPYDTVKDFAPVVLATAGPMLLAVHPSVPAGNVKSFIALAKSCPDELTCGSSGSGSTAHFALELLNHLSGSRIRHVPYKGAAQGMSDLLGGQISMYFGGVPPLLPHVKRGRLKGLAVSTRERTNSAPDIPTIAESGVAGYQVSGWYGVVAPAGTPREIVAQLNAQTVAQLRTPALQEKLAANGADIVASTPEQFASCIAAEITKWEKVIITAGVKVD